MFALDISGKNIRVLELSRENGNISIYGMAEKKCADQKNLPECIKEAMQSAKPNPIQSQQVIIAIPEEESFIKVIRLPKQNPQKINEFASHELEMDKPVSRRLEMDKPVSRRLEMDKPVSRRLEMKTSIEQEISKLLPYAPKEICWDWRLIKENSQDSLYDEIMVEAATKKTIDSHIETVNKAGLEPIIIETEANALVWGSINPFNGSKINEKEAVIKKEMSASEEADPTIILNFGATKITTVIFANGAVRFSASLRIEPEEQKNFLSEAKLESIAKKLKEYIDYYNDQVASQEKESRDSIKSLIISGEWASSQEIFSFLEKKLSLPVKGPTKIVPVETSYTRVAGLAFRGLIEEDHARF